MKAKAKSVKAIFDPYYPAPLETWEVFAAHLITRDFAKNEMIKSPGGTEKFLSIISTGAGGVFLWKEQASICLDLCYEREFFGDYSSFLTQDSTDLYTQALEATTLLSISFENLEELYQSSMIGVNIGRIAANSLFIHKQHQQVELLTMTAEQRYRQLLVRQPQIVQRTAQKHIASYLGVTPESFSRIRKKVAQE